MGYYAFAVTALSMTVSILVLFFVFFQAPSRQQKYLQLLTIITFAINLGISITVCYPPVEGIYAGSMAGTIITIVAGSHISYCFLLMCCSICHYKLPFFAKCIFLLGNTVFVTLGLTDVYYHHMYKSCDFVTLGPGNLIYPELGVGYKLYIGWHVLYFVVLCIILYSSTVKQRFAYKRMKRTVIGIIFCALIGLLPYVLTFLFKSGIDYTGVGCNVGCIFFILVIRHNKLYPVKENSQDIVLNEINDILLAYNAEYEFEYANRKAVECFPELENILFGTPLASLSEETNRLLNFNEGDIINLGNEEYKYSVFSTSEKEQITGYICWLHNVTEENRINTEILKLKQKAEEANIAKSRFLANISHEIRTPLNAVLGMDEMILRVSKEEETRNYANQIRRSGQMLLALINDILDFSKIEAGKMELVCADYNVRDMLSDIVMFNRLRAENKGLDIKLSIDDRIPGFLYGDESRIRQIITNIVTNAVKYTEHGYVEIAALAHFSKNGAFEAIVIKVHDTGIGIKEEDRSKLFDTFERIENDITRKAEGTGLGISITTQLLNLMGGTMEVESVYKVGSCFTLTIPQLPARESHPATGNIINSRVNRIAFTAPSADILIVDDNSANLAVAKLLLRDTEIHIDTLSSANAFLAQIQKKHYDIIFLDHKMPGIDGVEAFDRMSTMDHLCIGVPVVMMTADADPSARSYFLSHGLTDYIPKPLDPIVYENMVARLLPPSKIKIK